MIITKSGIIIRTPVKGISVIGRNTQGVRMMNIENGDSVGTITRIIGENEDIEKIKEEYKPGEEVIEETGTEELINNTVTDNITTEEENDSENRRV